MPILSAFPDGGGNGGGGVALDAITNISTLVSAGKVFVKWTDPEDVIYNGNVLAEWSGTILVRKAGSPPVSRRDGKIIVDSKIRNDYQNDYFCDSGLANGETYYYKLFPYTSDGTYTSLSENEFSATPTAQVMGIEDWFVTDMSASTEAGDGKIDITWTDPAADIVYEGITLNSWVSTTVVVKEGGYATDKNDADAAFVRKITTRNYHAVNPLTATGLTNGVTYYISFFPETDGGGINTSETQRVTGIANKITIDTIPSQTGILTYDGNSVSPSWNNYDSEKMTLGGTILGMNAGNYTATFTPTADYRWSDGTTTAKEVAWTIGKAAGSLTVSPTAITLNATTKTATITVTRAGTGKISASSNATGIATISPASSTATGSVTFTVSSVNDTTGSATITFSVAADTNHTAPSNKTVSVTAQFLPAEGKALNNYTWSEISQISAAGKGSNYFAVGDCKSVKVNGTIGTLAVNATYYVYIIGFNHNGATNKIDFGTFKTAATGGVDIALVDSLYESSDDVGTKKYFNINHSDTSTTTGGWKGCDMRYDILGSTKTKGANAASNTATSPVSNTLMAALPSDLRAVMKPMTIYTDNSGAGQDIAADVTSTVDYLPLLAEFEVTGVRAVANSAEKNYQKQYSYYSAGNPIGKYKHNGGYQENNSNDYAKWWLRSPRYWYQNSFCRVGSRHYSTISHEWTDPSIGYNNTPISLGIAPIFRV